MKSRSSGNATVIGLVIVVAVLLIGAGVWNYSRNSTAGTQTPSDTSLPTAVDTNTPITPVNTPATSTVPEVPATSTPVVVPKPPVSTTYKNGTYSANGSYFTPEGQESIGITLEIKNDIVTIASASIQARDGQSKRYQQMFASGLNSVVVGKKVDQINLTRVSGSSLTPKGFNDALAKIKVEAKA
jgi:hypothetical protein